MGDSHHASSAPARKGGVRFNRRKGSDGEVPVEDRKFLRDQKNKVGPKSSFQLGTVDHSAKVSKVLGWYHYRKDEREEELKVVKKVRAAKKAIPRITNLYDLQINFDADRWQDLINLSIAAEPAVTQIFEDQVIIEHLMSGESLDLPDFPSHAQSVERAVKLVSEASSSVYGLEARHKYILTKEKTGILFIGQGLDTVQSYGCTTNIKLPFELGSFMLGGVSVLNGKIYIYNYNKCYYGSLESSETEPWEASNCLSVGKSYPSMVSIGHQFIIVSGGWSNSQSAASMERFDANTNKWTTLINNLTSPRYLHCSVAISDTEMIVLGGFNEVVYFSTMEKYDVDGKLVATLPSMKIARGGLGCTLYKEELYAAGGLGGSYRLFDVEVYNMVTKEWRTINSMNTARFNPGLHVVDNILTVFGGGTTYRSLEYLNAAGNWEMSDDTLEKNFQKGDSVAIKCPA
ncbi:kelch-like protein 20 [Eurytemora carolleeae]|uniref:kelch-like protein 20 n=1 Tax=Eurytemora carolleeae TaxID=1294199 RepID=UPI000C7640CA|nr:kelch-like protein 20 [Eurytemora carolleeae]|eukprot:XP_023347138.1 kelch-like protein 20 [Eurytemora affinis]